MPTAQDILEQKGNRIFSIDIGATVLEATRKMNQHQIGALVVTRETRIVGIFTERDVLRRVVAEERQPSTVLLSSVMTKEVICCWPQTDIEEIASIMKTRRIRHIPICDQNGRLHGMISMGDINAHTASSQEATIHFLHEYIYGRA